MACEDYCPFFKKKKVNLSLIIHKPFLILKKKKKKPLINMQLKYEKEHLHASVQPFRRLTIATSAFLFLGRTLVSSAATVFVCVSSLYQYNPPHTKKKQSY